MTNEQTMCKYLKRAIDAHSHRVFTNSNKSLIVHNQRIYSYGKHWPLAIAFPNMELYVNVDKYSRTTSKHTAMIKRLAKEYGYTVIECSKEVMENN